MAKLKRGPKYNSITALMKEKLRAQPMILFGPAQAIVKKHFPKSRFNERHLSWYKSALKRGALKGVR